MLWNPELLAKIDAADDLKIAPYHPDMNTTGTPTWIWEVKVDNRLFVRAYSGTHNAGIRKRMGCLTPWFYENQPGS